MQNDWRRDPIASAERGENPTLLARMRTGFALFGYTQFLPGYCLLIRTPKVANLNDLDIKSRTEFLLDMSLLGEAIEKVCHPLRVNYSIYGNEAAFLHAHLFPRYEWEPEYNRKNPVWTYPESNWTEPSCQWSKEKHGGLMTNLSNAINEIMQTSY